MSEVNKETKTKFDSEIQMQANNEAGNEKEVAQNSTRQIDEIEQDLEIAWTDSNCQEMLKDISAQSTISKEFNTDLANYINELIDTTRKMETIGSTIDITLNTSDNINSQFLKANGKIQEAISYVQSASGKAADVSMKSAVSDLTSAKSSLNDVSKNITEIFDEIIKIESELKSKLDVLENQMSNNKVQILDYSRIATSAQNASIGNFINESKIKKEYWGDDGELEYEKRKDGTYVIKENGVILGYTDKLNLEENKTNANNKKDYPTDGLGNSKTNNLKQINFEALGNYYSNAEIVGSGVYDRNYKNIKESDVLAYEAQDGSGRIVLVGKDSKKIIGYTDASQINGGKGYNYLNSNSGKNEVSNDKNSVNYSDDINNGKQINFEALGNYYSNAEIVGSGVYDRNYKNIKESDVLAYEAQDGSGRIVLVGKDSKNIIGYTDASQINGGKGYNYVGEPKMQSSASSSVTNTVDNSEENIDYSSIQIQNQVYGKQVLEHYESKDNIFVSEIVYNNINPSKITDTSNSALVHNFSKTVDCSNVNMSKVKVYEISNVNDQNLKNSLYMITDENDVIIGYGDYTTINDGNAYSYIKG